jgi:hypothetical protein
MFWGHDFNFLLFLIDDKLTIQYQGNKLERKNHSTFLPPIKGK